jgi:hypothetical protein
MCNMKLTKEEQDIIIQHRLAKKHATRKWRDSVERGRQIEKDRLAYRESLKTGGMPIARRISRYA